MSQRIVYFLENTCKWPRTQYGFRRGYSTLDNITILITDILLAFHRKQYVETIFIDVAKAYDSVIPHIMIKKLQELQINGKMAFIIYKLITQRRLLIKYNNTGSEKCSTSMGLPQGSSLSPVLYNIYTAQIEKSVMKYARILQFADDIIIYLPTNSLNHNNTQIQKAFDELQRELEELGLTINISKTMNSTG